MCSCGTLWPAHCYLWGVDLWCPVSYWNLSLTPWTQGKLSHAPGCAPCHPVFVSPAAAVALGPTETPPTYDTRTSWGQVFIDNHSCCVHLEWMENHPLGSSTKLVHTYVLPAIKATFLCTTHLLFSHPIPDQASRLM